MKAKTVPGVLGWLRACLSLFTCLWLATASAQTAAPAYGVWRGTLGAQDVMVNLKPATCGSSYYDMRHLWGIPLKEMTSGNGPWREGVNPEAGPAWAINLATDSVLEGIWTDAQGQRSLPLRLKKIAAGPDKPEDCHDPKYASADAAFNAPRVAAKAPEASTTSFDGRRYRVLTVPQTEIKALQIPNEPQPVPRLNLYLRQWLQSEVAAYYDCQLNISKQGLEKGTDPKPDDYSSQYEPEFWNAHLLVLRENFYHECADVHPFWGIDGRLVWDLDADRALNPMEWLRGTRVENGWDLPPKLKTVVVRRYARAADDDASGCVEAASASSYDLFPNAKGMVFRPTMPHVLRACEEDILVSWRELQPFLTPSGARLVREKILRAAR